MALRVIGGEFRGRKLKAPEGESTRPTSDRVREAIFSVLGHRILEARFLDAFAGTGAVGIEALSRGAATVVFVESSPQALRALDANLALFPVGDRVRVHRKEFARAVRWLEPDSPFDLIYLDPPYGPGELLRALRLAATGGLLASEGRLVAEHDRSLEVPESEGDLRRVRLLKYGRTRLSIYAAG